MTAARTLTDADVEAIAAKLAELVGRDPPANERPRRRGQHTRRVARPEVRAIRTTDLNAGDIAILTIAVLLGFRPVGGSVRR